MPDHLTLARQIDALGKAVALSRGRAPDEVLADAEQTIRRIGERVALSGERTVVALAGATGSGKSSLFNALTGSEWAEVAVRRPTTGEAMAAAWGGTAPQELLDWLEIGTRHVLPAGGDLDGLLLIDLPDYDSVELHHREIVDRLVQVVDALVWVVDPEKYADASLHEGYLRPLATHAEVMLVVFNKIDRLTESQMRQCMRDMRRLLDQDGLQASPVMRISAATGTGVDDLRTGLARMVAAKAAMVRRLSADLRQTGDTLAETLGEGAPPLLNRRSVVALTTALGDAAGVPIMVDAARQAWQRRGQLATGWPFISWISALRPDPLKRLRSEAKRLADGAPVRRSSLPKGGAVQTALVDRRLRELVDSVADELPRGWRDAVEQAAFGGRASLVDELDVAIMKTDLGVEKRSWWWPWFRVLQWVLVAAVVVGVLWLVVGPVIAATGLSVPDPNVLNLPLATWLLGGGLVLGVVLGLVGRLLVNVSAQTKAAGARHLLDEAVGAVVDDKVARPVQTELDRYSAAVRAVRALR